MSRAEGEPVSKENKVMLGLTIALAVMGTPVAIGGLIKESEFRKDCISSGQIDLKGQKLEGFVAGRGCERFSPSRVYYLHSPMGSW